MTEYQIETIIRLIDNGWVTEDMASHLVQTWPVWVSSEEEASLVVADIEAEYWLATR